MMTRWPLTLVVAFLTGTPAAAQWLQYPTARVPRDSHAKPNLAAPVPRTFDGKPDLSGLWQLDTSCPPQGCEGANQVGDYPVAPEFRNFGARLRNGLPYQPWAADLVKQRSEQNGKDDPVILSERDVTYRQIFTDGRPLPKDPEPSFNGYSTGRWVKDTLVVETNGLREGWLDRRGSPITDVARITEKFRRVNYGRLEVEVTVDDPKAYTTPFTVTLNQKILLDTDLLEYHCNDNEKDRAHLVGR